MRQYIILQVIKTIITIRTTDLFPGDLFSCTRDLFSRPEKRANMVSDIFLYVGFLFCYHGGVFCQTIDLDIAHQHTDHYENDCKERVFPGDSIILTAVLDRGHEDTADWPVDNIVHGQAMHDAGTSASLYTDVCQINIEKDGCNGFQPSACGYCQAKTNGIYHIVFHQTAGEGGRYHTFRCNWYGKKGDIISATKTVWVSNLPPFILRKEDTVTWTFSQLGNVTGRNSQLSTEFCMTGWQNLHEISNKLDERNEMRDESCTTFELEAIKNISDANNMILFPFQNKCNKKQILTFSRADITPQTLSCDDPVFTKSGKDKAILTWKCSCPHEQSFSCYIGLRGKLDTVPGKGISSNHSHVVTKTDDNPPTFVHECNVEFLHYHLSDGRHDSSVHELAGIVQYSHSSSIAYEAKSNSTLALSNLPVAKVNGNCPIGDSVSNGAIRLGSSATCTCEMSSPGSPPGHVQWFDAKGKQIGQPGTTANLLIEGEFHGENQIYTCKGVSDAGREEPGIPFVPQFFDFVKVINQPSGGKSFTFYFGKGSDVIISLEIYSYPEPTEYVLKVEEGSEISTVSKDKYQIIFSKLTMTNGLVTIVYQQAQPSKTYVLNVKNGFGEGLDIKFVYEVTDSGSSVQNWLIVFLNNTIWVVVLFMAVKCKKFRLFHPRKGHPRGWKRTFEPFRQLFLFLNRCQKSNTGNYKLQEVKYAVLEGNLTLDSDEIGGAGQRGRGENQNTEITVQNEAGVCIIGVCVHETKWEMVACQRIRDTNQRKHEESGSTEATNEPSKGVRKVCSKSAPPLLESKKDE